MLTVNVYTRVPFVLNDATDMMYVSAKDLIDNMILVDKKKRFTIQQVIVSIIPIPLAPMLICLYMQEHKWLKNIEVIEFMLIEL